MNRLYHNERIRQAKLAFNLYFAFVGISAGLTIAGFACLLVGYTSQKTYATLAAGLTSTAVGRCCLRFSKEANDRLDRITLGNNDKQINQ